MYGQGSYAPQYRQGPPVPPPMYQQPPPIGPPQPMPYQQAPPPGPPRPPVYQHGPLPPPPAPPVNMGQPYMHPPPPPLQPSYVSYPPPPPQQMSMPPPRMLPPPPPPPQGQVMYRPPHMFTPPPPPPSSFMSPYPSFTPVGEAPLPPLPASPPPLPPSSPPPPPPPPPPPSATACSPDVPDVEEELKHPTSPPPRPDDEVVHTIEEFCRLIADNGVEFENFATKKEAENPDFAFLFSGPPGSAEAIGHDYYKWVKRNYKFVEKSQNDVQDGSRTGDKDGASQSSDPEDEETAASPAVSDMDMEDDVTPDGDSGSDNVTKLSTREPLSVSNKTDSVKEPSHVLGSTVEKLVLPPGNVSEDDVSTNGHWGIDAVRNRSARDIVPGRNNMDAEPSHESGSTMELVQEVAVSGTLTCPDSLPLLQDGGGSV